MELKTDYDIFAELDYMSYRANRIVSPHISPERWKKIYKNVDEMEKRFQNEKA